MALNRTEYTSGNYIPNQNFDCLYFKPKTENQMKDLTVNTTNMTVNQINEFYDNFQSVDGIGWVSKSGVHFKCAEGTEDVYKKMGLDSALDEYQDRTQYEDIKWRIITNAPHIDFKVGGMVRFGDHDFRIMKVVYAFSTGTTPNKFRFYKGNTLDRLNRQSPKLLVLG